MADHPIIAIGSYSDTDREAMRDAFGACFAADVAALDSLPGAVRDNARVLALKGHGPLGGEAMDRLPSLGLIANYGVGYDAIDIEAARTRGIRVSNTPDVLNDDVADMAILLWLAEARGLVHAERFVREGLWRCGAFPLRRSVTGRRAGILGLGRIGRAIAERLQPFGVEIHYFSRSDKETPGWTHHADPLALAAAVDDLFVAVVGGTETEGLVDAPVLRALGTDGVLINISRGSVIDEEALIVALTEGTISGAGLDVFRNEPDIDVRFLDLPNTVLQPHIATGTFETRTAIGALQRRNIAAFLTGEALPTPVV